MEQRVDDYVLREELGRGNMGVVYRAHDPRLGRDVALKVILDAGLTGEVELARFQTEAQVMAQLRHPHVVPILGAGVAQGRPYLAMELVPGESLSERIKRAGRLDPQEAVPLAAALARALGHAHARGIVHRDVKPDNVLIDAGGVPRLTDFGLAKVIGVGRGLTVTGELLGTPHYMAPESAHGDKDRVGPATDVYALGVTLFHMLTGQVPYAGSSLLEVLDKAVTEPTPRLRERVPELDKELEAICAEAMAKDPAQRPPDGDALAARLEAWTAPATAPPRRAPPWALALGAGLVGATLGVTGAALALRRPPPAPAVAPTPTPTPTPAPAADAAPDAPQRKAARALIRQARLLAEEGQARLALQLLEVAEPLAPDAPSLFAVRGFALWIRDGNAAGHKLNELLEVAERIDPQCAGALLREARRKGVPYTESLALMDRAIALEPEAAWLRFARAVYHKQHPDPKLGRERSRAGLTDALRLNPRFLKALLWRADLNLVDGRYDEAIRDATQALEVDPRCFVAYIKRALGSLRHDDERVGVALTDYRFAEAVASSGAERARAILGVARIRLKFQAEGARGRVRRMFLEQALRAAKQGARADPSASEAWSLQAQVLQQQKQWRDAQAAIDAALQRAESGVRRRRYEAIRAQILRKRVR